MIRVAMIGNYPVDPKVVPGGVTAVAHYLVRGVAALDEIDLHMICCQTDVPRDSVTERDGATVHFLHDSGRFTMLLDRRLQRRKIARVLRRIRPDLVHAQGVGLAGAAAIDSGLPFALSLHGITWKESTIHHPSRIKSLRGRLRKHSDYRQILATRNVFITSGYAAEMLPAEGSYRQFVVNNPVGDDLFALRNEPGPPHVLVVGGLRHRKDPLTAIRTMERVLASVPEATLHLLGPQSGTPLDDEVAGYVAAHGLGERIRLLGLVPDEVLKAEYERATLMLLTSLEETAPVAIGEACAVGLPVVGTDAGGIPHLVREGETGFVRPIGDVAGLAERVVAVLTDAELRGRLAAGARAVGEADFRLDRIARKTADAYAEILGRTGRG